MKGRKLPLIGAGIFTLSSILSAHAQAETPKGAEADAPYNQVASESIDYSVFNAPEGDFIFVTDYMHPTNRNETTNFNELLKGGNVKRIYAIDPSQAIQSRINFLNSEKAVNLFKALQSRINHLKFPATKEEEFYGEEQRLNLIGRYQNFLGELDRKKVKPSKKSLESLSLALKGDGIVTPEELKDVQDSVYAIIKEGTDKEKGDYAVFYLTDLVSEKTSAQYEAMIKELRGRYNELEDAYNKLVKEEELAEKESGTEKPSELPASEPKGLEEKALDAPKATAPKGEGYELPEPEAPDVAEIYEKGKMEEAVMLHKVEEKSKVQRKGRNLVSLIFGGNAGEDFYTGEFGVRFESREDVGVSLIGRVGYVMDKVISEIRTPTSPSGVYGEGKITEKDIRLCGVDFEVQAGAFFAGMGLGNQNHIEETREKLFRGEELIKKNKDSIPCSQVSANIYAGAEVKLGKNKNLGVGVKAGYDSLNGPYAGGRMSVRLNRPRREKRR